MAHSMAANPGAYNTSDGDMTTIMSNGRGTMDLTSRIGTGGDAMPGARVGTDFVAGQPAGAVAEPLDPAASRRAMGRTTPPAPMQEQEQRQAQSESTRMLEKIPGGSVLANHPEVRALAQRVDARGRAVPPGDKAAAFEWFNESMGELRGAVARLSSRPPLPPAAQPHPLRPGTAMRAAAETPSDKPMPAWFWLVLVTVISFALVAYAAHKGWLRVGAAPPAAPAAPGSAVRNSRFEPLLSRS